MNLPKGWVEIPLIEVARHRSGNSKLIKGKLSSSPTPELFPAFSASGQDVWHTSAEHEGCAIIVSAVGARCGKAFRADGAWSAIANTHVIWPEAAAIDRDFLFYRINDERFWERGGSAQPFVKVTATLARPFLLPPLAEQRRIVAKLDALLARVRKARESLDRLPAMLERMRQSVLAAAFRGDLTKEWREAHPDVEPAEKLLERIRVERRRRWEESLRAKGRDPAKAKYVEPEPVDATELPELPKGWAWASLSGLASSIRNGVSPKPYDAPPGVPVLRISAVRSLELRLGEVRYLREERDFGSFELRPGDLLFTRYNGSLNLVGVCALVRTPPAGLVYPDKLIRVRVEGVSPEYVELAASAPAARLFIEARAKSTSGQTGVSGADLGRLPIPVPPLEEQRVLISIVQSLLTAANSVSNSVANERTRLDSLEQSLLAKAFRGELVPQDPSDEPASVLLDRIRAERAAEEKPRRGRKVAGGARAARRAR